MSQTKAQLISDLVQALNFTGTASAPANGAFLSATNTLALATNSAQRLTIDSSGLVGIGTTSPVAPFHVYNATNNTIARLESGDATARLHLKDNSGEAFVEATGNNLIFSNTSSTTERIRIDSSGRVLYGHTSNITGSTLQWFLGIGGAAADLFVASDNDQPGTLNIHKTRSTTPSGNTILQDGDKIGELRFRGNTGAGYVNGAVIQAIVNGTPGSGNDLPTDLVFRLQPDGSGNTFEPMRIASSGNVGIGTASPIAKLHVHNSGTGSGDHAYAYFTTGDTGATASDGLTIGVAATAVASISYREVGDLTFGTSGTERMRIKSGGNVGIGTTNPGDSLDIASTVPTLRLTDTDGGPSYHQIKGPGNGDLRISCDVGNTSSSASEIQFDIHDSNKMVIQSTGNVGIGTSSISDDADHCKLVISGQAQNAAGVLIFQDTSNNEDGMVFADNGCLYLVADRANATADSFMAFRVDGSSEKMRLDSSGRLGIGTTTGAVGGAPSSQTGQFNVVSSAASGQWAMQARADNAAGNGLFLRAGANSSYYTAYLTGNDENNVHMVVRGDGKVGIGTASPTKKLSIDTGTGSDGIFLASDEVGINIVTSNTGDSHGRCISFNASRTDSGSLPFLRLGGQGGIIFAVDINNERMRLDSSGNLGIGTSSPNDKLQVHGTITQVNSSTSNTSSQLFFNNQTSGGQYRVRFDSNSSTVGSIQVFTSSTAYNTTSDYRLKENITTITDGITRLKTLIPRRFNFKNDPTKTVDGFIAHEVTAVPESITGTKDEVATEDSKEAKKGDPIYQQIDQAKLVPLLVAAVQELITKVETLEAA